MSKQFPVSIRATYKRMTRDERAQVRRIVEERVAHGLQATDGLVHDTQLFVLADRRRPVDSKAEAGVAHWRGELVCHGGDVLTT